MYTSYIGKKFLKLFKEKYNKPEDYSAKQFFDEEMFPIFFDDERHMMHVTNSPFFQRVSDNQRVLFDSVSEAQFANLKENIKKKEIGGNIYVGYGSSDIASTTSGQMTNMEMLIDEDEIYASWIGQALAVGVKGGYANLMDRDELLFKIYEGWKHYKKFLSQTPDVKDKQIETWNGEWLKLRFNANDDEINYNNIETGISVGKLAIQTIQWPELIFLLAGKYKNTVITSYVYLLSQTNETLGYINIYLDQIQKIFDVRDKVFIDSRNNILKDHEIQKLIPFFSFKEAAKMGTIGLKSIEPKGLRAYLPKGTYNYSQGQDFKFKENIQNQLFIIKLWITAMLNKTELLELSRELAGLLIENQKETNKTKRATTISQVFVKEMLDSRSVKGFIEKLAELNENLMERGETLRKIVEQVLVMPRDNFPLFIALIKFEYSFLKNQSEN